MSKEDNQPKILIDIITARQNPQGLFVIRTGKDSPDIPLNWYLGIVTSCRGTWQSLGMAFNPSPGFNCMEISVYYAVQQDSGFELQIASLVEKIKERENEQETGNTESEGTNQGS